ncbi:keywimysin-related RiPP [Kitasatospora sp. NPDC008050]|uniref:keywimysin-related RiPP n=1 Tax=Kitasatospora sp. NPDC008050 TaxID=3364021 RepID=UPI0036E01FA4
MDNNKSVETLELQAYETPEVFEVGSFREDTGYIGTVGGEPWLPSIPSSWW